MSEQQTTPQVEEPVDAQVQPEATVEGSEPVSTDKVAVESAPVVEAAEKPVVEGEEAESVEAKPEEVSTTEAVSKDDEEKPVEESDSDRKKVEESDSDRKKVEEPDSDRKKVEESDSDKKVDSEDKIVEPVTATEETNGVCKRKADNGAEAVEDEKSPKKVKVVDNGDNATVEETAA